MAFYRKLSVLLSRGTLILIVTALGAVGLGLAGLATVEHELIKRAGESLALGAFGVADKLDIMMHERAGDIEILAASTEVRTGDAAVIRQHLTAILAAYPVYARVTVTDAGGRVLASTDQGMQGGDAHTTPWFQAVWSVPRLYVATVEEPRAGGRLRSVRFAAPIRSAEGAFRGVIMTEVDRATWRRFVVEVVDRFASQGQNLGPVDFRVVSATGEGLLTTDEQELRTDNLRTLNLPSAVRVGAGQQGFVEEEHVIRKVPVVTGYARTAGVSVMQDLQWGILVRADRSAILMSIQAVLVKIGLVGTAGLIPMVGLIWWSNLKQQEEEAKALQAQHALAQSEAQTKTVLNEALDAVIVMDSRGLVQFWNKQAEQIFGWSEKEAAGRALATLIVPPQHREAHREGVARYLETGEGLILGKRIEITAVHKSGHEFPIEITINPVRMDREVRFSAFLRDISDRVHAERAKKVQAAIALAITGDLMDASIPATLLEAIAASLNWAAGVWWIPEDPDRLQCQAVWSADPAAHAPFLEATRGLDFARGIGLPGRVWAQSQPAWIADLAADQNFPRQEAAVQSGLRGAFAIPIPYQGGCGGVLEFFAADAVEPDEHLLAVIAQVGAQVGGAMERRDALRAQRESELRARNVIEGALDAVVIMNERGMIIEWNKPAEQMFGWTRAEALGRPLGETIVPPSLRKAHDAGLATYLATGAGPVLNQHIEISAMRRHGEEFPIELAIIPLKLERTTIFSAFIRDITERKRLLARLNEREMYFRLMSAQLPVGVFEVNAEGLCVYGNQMWRTILKIESGDGSGTDALPSGQWIDWAHPDDRAPLREGWAAAVSLKAPIQHEYRLAGTGDEPSWVQLNLWPMATDGRIRYLGVMEDITARKRTAAQTVSLLQQGLFELRTLAEARNLAELLSYAFPDPARAHVGLVELLVNGVEHGNLDISYAEKSALLEQGKLDEEMARRMALPEYARKRVRIALDRCQAELQLSITDDGRGFDWEQYLDFSAEREDDSHGRGIAMSKAISFDRLEYRGSGNQVVVATRLGDADFGPEASAERRAA